MFHLAEQALCGVYWGAVAWPLLLFGCSLDGLIERAVGVLCVAAVPSCNACEQGEEFARLGILPVPHLLEVCYFVVDGQ